MLSLKNWLPSLVEGFTLYGGGKGGGKPKSPDYSRLAQEQAQQQLAINRSTTQANRVDQFTPFGSLTYTQGTGAPTFDQAGYDNATAQYNKALQAYYAPQQNNLSYLGFGGYNPPQQRIMPVAPSRDQFYSKGNPDKWSSQVTLTPEVQNIVDQKLAAQSQNYDALQSYLKNINDSNLVPKSPVNPGQTAQDAIMARLNPQWQSSEESLRSNLINQGLRPGTEAWDNEFRNFSQGKNDAYNQAALYGINLDTQAHQNALQEQALPMNAIQSYANGTQTSYPQFTNYAQQANASAPDLMGAGQASYNGQLNAYNANQASDSNFMNGLFGLAGTAATFFSDRRLKTNIEKIGTYQNGLNKYSFDYIWGEKGVGAMADEVEKVMPEAVGERDGFKTVNYAMLGV